MICTRFAPSPTGSLHIGGARTALYNYLFAKNNKGEFLLRVEDTDRERHVAASQYTQMSDLAWLGLDWDLGVMPDGQMKGPEKSYKQSERAEIYAEIIEKLLSEGKAFYCFLTDDELEQMRDQAMKEKKPFRVVSPYRDDNYDSAKVKAQTNPNFTIRMRNDYSKTYHFEDLVRGPIDLSTEMVGDFVLMRSGGMPVYNFACVVDDHLMKVTHVLRGEEHLSNTVRQLMVYESMAWQPPQFGHLSVIVGKDRKKLSKRDDAVSVEDFKQHGYLPEALLNAMVLLGWSDPDGREVVSLDDMIASFDLERLHVSAAMFDREKLLWLNAHYLRAMDSDELYNRLKALKPDTVYEEAYHKDVINDVIALYKHDVHTLCELDQRLDLVLGEMHIVPEALEVLTWETSLDVIKSWHSHLHESPELVKSDFSGVLSKIKLDCDVKGKRLFMPLRVALLGAAHGAELKDLVQVMPIDVMIKRADACLKQIGLS